MKLNLISDAHFCDGSAADDAGPARGALDRYCLKLAEQCRARHERIAILGDLLELQQASLLEIVLAHGEALEALASVTEIYILGNHDWSLLQEPELPGFLRKLNVEVWGASLPMADGGRVWLEHGQFHDPFVARWPRISAAAVWITGGIERILGRDFDIWACRLWDRFQAVGRYGANTAYLPAVSRICLQHDCNTAVFGHTHQLLQSGVRCSVMADRPFPPTDSRSPTTDHRPPTTDHPSLSTVVVYNSGALLHEERDSLFLEVSDG